MIAALWSFRVLAAGWLLAAGAPPPSGSAAPGAPPSTPVAPSSGAAGVSGAAPDASARPVLARGRITRAEVEAVYQQGAQRLVAGLEVAGAREGRRFAGFRILRIRPDGPLGGLEAIVPGDVVLDVNGFKLERPDQFMKAWAAVREAPTVRVQVLRGAERLALEWEVVP